MALAGWSVPLSGRLHRAPVAATVEWLFPEVPQHTMDDLCDFVFNIERDITPELARGAPLRQFVYQMMGSQFRFFDARAEELADYFGKSGKKIVINQRLCLGLIEVSLAPRSKGAPELWIKEKGQAIRDRFAQENLEIMTLPGGPGGFESAISHISSLTATIHEMRGATAMRDQETKAELVATRSELAETRQQLGVLSGKLSSLMQALSSGAGVAAPTAAAPAAAAPAAAAPAAAAPAAKAPAAAAPAAKAPAAKAPAAKAPAATGGGEREAAAGAGAAAATPFSFASFFGAGGSQGQKRKAFLIADSAAADTVPVDSSKQSIGHIAILFAKHRVRSDAKMDLNKTDLSPKNRTLIKCGLALMWAVATIDERSAWDAALRPLPSSSSSSSSSSVVFDTVLALELETRVILRIEEEERAKELTAVQSRNGLTMSSLEGRLRAFGTGPGGTRAAVLDRLKNKPAVEGALAALISVAKAKQITAAPVPTAPPPSSPAAEEGSGGLLCSVSAVVNSILS